MASKAAPKLLVCPVMRAILPSRTSANRPTAHSASPSGVSIFSDPCIAKAAPVTLIKLGMVKTSLATLWTVGDVSRAFFIVRIITSICQNSNIIVTSSYSPREA